MFQNEYNNVQKNSTTAIVLALFLGGLVVMVSSNAVGCGPLPTSSEPASSPSLPAYDVVGRQGIVRMVHISADVLLSDDALWAIADELLSGRAIQAMFWTDRSRTPTSLPMTTGQVESLRAQININEYSGLRELVRMD